jgi:hypothetical protein
MDMLRLLAAIAVLLMIVAICASLGEDRPAVNDVTQPAADLLRGAERAAGNALRAAGRDALPQSNAVSNLPLNQLHPPDPHRPHHRG